MYRDAPFNATPDDFSSRRTCALEESGWKVKGPGYAAERLGLSPSTLRSRMKRLGIERPGPS